MSSIRASVVVKLDMEKINSLRLCINAYTIKDKIESSLAKRKNDKLVNIFLPTLFVLLFVVLFYI